MESGNVCCACACLASAAHVRTHSPVGTCSTAASTASHAIALRKLSVSPSTAARPRSLRDASPGASWSRPGRPRAAPLISPPTISRPLSNSLPGLPRLPGHHQEAATWPPIGRAPSCADQRPSLDPPLRPPLPPLLSCFHLSPFTVISRRSGKPLALPPCLLCTRPAPYALCTLCARLRDPPVRLRGCFACSPKRAMTGVSLRPAPVH